MGASSKSATFDTGILRMSFGRHCQHPSPHYWSIYRCALPLGVVQINLRLDIFYLKNINYTPIETRDYLIYFLSSLSGFTSTPGPSRSASSERLCIDPRGGGLISFPSS